MELYVATEQRFWQFRNVHYAEAVAGIEFWTRYLDAFSVVNVVARVNPVEQLPQTAVRVSGKDVRVVALPGYLGPIQGLLKLPIIWQRLADVSSKRAAFLLRVPGAIGTMLYWQLRRRNWPYGVEIVGDPADSLSKQALGTSWSMILRPLAVYLLRQQAFNASCATYVTRDILQNSYPSNATFNTSYSDVELKDEHFERPRVYRLPEKSNVLDPYRLIFIGSLAQRYKGLHVLLQAVRISLDHGLELRLRVLGDGRYLSESKLLARELGLEKEVTFCGYLVQGQAVINQLSDAELFVIPSLVEGLPRALIEAMSLGLPCIGSRIGGIPELLPATDMVPPNDAQSLAHKLMEVLPDQVRMKQMGQRNRQTAKQYHPEILDRRRRTFYGSLHDITVEHIQSAKKK